MDRRGAAGQLGQALLVGGVARAIVRHSRRLRPAHAAARAARQRQEWRTARPNRRDPPALGPGAVVLVSFMVEPRHHRALIVGFLHCQMGHETVGSSSVPMLFAGFDGDHGLSPGVCVPRGARTGGEAHVPHPMADWSSGFRTVSMKTVPVNQSAGPRPLWPEHRLVGARRNMMLLVGVTGARKPP